MINSLSDRTWFPRLTWQNPELGLVAGLGRPHVLHQAAVEAGVGLRGVVDHQGSARQQEQPAAELQRLAVLLPPSEGHQVGVDLARHHLTVPQTHGGRRRLAGEPGHPWKTQTRGGCESNSSQYAGTCTEDSGTMSISNWCTEDNWCCFRGKERDDNKIILI